MSPRLTAEGAILLVIDLQARLVPALADGGAMMMANAARLVAGAGRLGLPVVATEQNPAGLGGTVPGLLPAGVPVLSKMTFDASPVLAPWLEGMETAVICGCEAHVCVLQTAMAIAATGRRVAVVADAVGSRTEANRAAALTRMAEGGVEVATTEMVLFEWLGGADHPAFRDILALIR